MKISIPSGSVRIFFVSIILLVLVFGAYFLFIHQEKYPELKTLNGVSWSSKQYAEYFKDLAKHKGSGYAFNVLRALHVPLGINAHTIGHGIGDVLYEEKGTAGMGDCTEEFRNACSHAIVIQTLIENGSHAISDIVAACQQAPGGFGSTIICYHGVGHGVVAYAKYDFKEAVELCKQATASFKSPPTSSYLFAHRFTNAFGECVGGAVMEMTAGAHDEEAWSRQWPNFLSENDIFKPCDSDLVPEEVRSNCYVSLTQRLFVALGALDEIPSPNLYPRLIGQCQSAPPGEQRTACYGGFGKEFVFYATQLDTGNVNALTDEAFANIRTWCSYATDSDGIARCLSIALDTLFWTGQNDPNSAMRFCETSPNTDRHSCFVSLAEDIRYFLQKDIERNKELCIGLPEDIRELCESPA